jgi:hypothetical protein
MGACFSCVDTVAQTAIPIFADTGPNLNIIPLADQPHLLDLPLNGVSVMSSHNSYIRTFQHGGESSVDALRISLDRGARFLELDVYRDPANPHNVFVAHGKEELPTDILTTTRLPLAAAFAAIAAHAFTRTNDPLFIALELNVHNDEAACDTIASLIDINFGPRLLAQPLTPTTSLRALLDKVVFMTGGGVAGTNLPSRISVSWNAEFQNISSETPATNIDGSGNCIRVYPAGDIKGALSLNFNPIPYLMRGATFVALNVCTADTHMDYYATWFAHSSFVKKPQLT